MGGLDDAFVAVFTRLFRNQLKIRGRATALARILTSQHTIELRWVGLIVSLLIASFLWFEWRELFDAWSRTDGHPLSFDPTKLLSLGVLGGALSWAYTTGNQRLGTIDLFACEISTLCRVTLVLDFAKKEIERISNPPAATSNGEAPKVERFSSEEKYTPVFDTNLKALESLDMYVVCKVTEFYTYRKAMMDFMRKARGAVPGTAEWRLAMEEMLYMQYLMFESARHAIQQLIEFDPDREESLINVFCSELTLFHYLIQTTTDFRLERLRLRRDEYRRQFGTVQCRVNHFGDRPEWQKAKTTLRELERRYEVAKPSLAEPA